MPSICYSILNEKKNTVPIYCWDYSQWSIIYRGEIWSRSFSDDTDLALHTVEYKMVHFFIINMDPKS